MKRKEILAAIESNPNCALYILYGNKHIGLLMHHQTSKTQLLKNAKNIHSVRVSTYGEERPDLDPKRYTNLAMQIVTFDMSVNT